jgi:Ni,Fe-hydrogenase III large subunit/Ni,Fe-hydrogenase III component G
MPIKHPNLKLTKLTDALPAWVGEIAPEDLCAICQQVRDSGGRLVALWGSDARKQSEGFKLHLVVLNEIGLVCLNVPLSAEQPTYPDLSHIFPVANRMQRAAYDMLGIYAQGSLDHRKWLRHGAWHSGSFPLRKDFDAAASDPHLNPLPQTAPLSNSLPQAGERTNEKGNLEFLGEEAIVHSPTANGIQPLDADDYPFVQVEGQGVHEIPVGPVHAGIIEPGHFRFSIIGETVLRLEERFGYAHKGIEKLFESRNLRQGATLAGRVSGDSTVAYAWAYAMAAENIAKVTPSSRALWMRALLLERERVANHLGDLGYLGNDVALTFGFAQFWILKEQVLRNNAALFGHRYLMDKIVPGGVSVTLAEEGKLIIGQECDMLEQQVRILRGIYEEHAGMQDRFISTGVVEPKLAAQLGLCGLAGRASAQAWDARVQFASSPYDKLDVQMATYRNGDVAARVIVRFDELLESLRLQREILVNLIVDEEKPAMLEKLPPNGFGIGMVEGWRGEVLVAIHTDAQGNLARVHPHDPSWQNWPVLEHAIIDNIVPDFPLINKSFNLSYSGQDL